MADPRDRFISKVSKGKSFIDVGGLYEIVKERVSVAHSAGAIDLTLMDIEKPDCPWWLQLRNRLDERGVGECKFISGDITSERNLQTYDVVHSSGVLYHLPSPFAYLLRLRQMTREWCILASSTIPTTLKVDERELNFPNSTVLFIPALAAEERDIVVEWYRRRGRGDITDGGHSDLTNYYPNWFLPTVPAFRAMAICAGFEIADEAEVEAEELSYCLLLR